MRKIIDAHIHVDGYNKEEQEALWEGAEAFIGVSSDYPSCFTHLEIAKENPKLRPAFGFHPEQTPPSAKEMTAIKELSKRHADQIVAIGEVGLPYYLKKKQPSLDMTPYIETLKEFIQLAEELEKPIILHAIYEDAELACELLKDKNVNAHFHWFKGSSETLREMIRRNYFISVTPDCLYEKEIQTLIEEYPLEFMMVETDGPWRFKGPFEGKITHPSMIHSSIEKIASIKRIRISDVYKALFDNTRRFYKLKGLK
ncbi:TatD family deoxyribonuclease [Halobacillus fulvus]|nr:TatD family deoxyribonuclease [Halobacillus fulvus]